jgi:hypothetical protein
MLEELLRKVKDLKSVVMDRLHAVTESGAVLSEVFEDIEELINDELKKKGKK